MIGLLSLALIAMTQDSPDKIVLDLGGGVKMEFVKIKAGKLTMGSNDTDGEKPPHEVTLTKDYWMQSTEISQAQWKAVMIENPSRFKRDDLPVESVNWDDCHEFLKKLSEKAKDQLKGKTACLPTEAQWEYACRAGSTTRWCFGDYSDRLDEYAWYDENSVKETHPVATKKPNEWGLYDMHGNVFEWCEDAYDAYPSQAVTDPTGPPRGNGRVLRGGSWANYVLEALHSSYRMGFPSDFHSDMFGFRVVLRSSP